jgi:hypothetical protein
MEASHKICFFVSHSINIQFTVNKPKEQLPKSSQTSKINSLNVVFCMLYSNGLYVTFFFGFVRCTVYDLKINFYNIPEEKFITNILK